MTLNLRESLNFILKPALLLAGCLCMACSSGDKHVDDPDGPDNPGGGEGEVVNEVDPSYFQTDEYKQGNFLSQIGAAEAYARFYG